MAAARYGPGNGQPAQDQGHQHGGGRVQQRCSPGDSRAWRRPRACARSKRRCAAADSIAAWPQIKPDATQSVPGSQFGLGYVPVVVPEKPAPPRPADRREENRDDQGRRKQPRPPIQGPSGRQRREIRQSGSGHPPARGLSTDGTGIRVIVATKGKKRRHRVIAGFPRTPAKRPLQDASCGTTSSLAGRRGKCERRDSNPHRFPHWVRRHQRGRAPKKVA